MSMRGGKVFREATPNLPYEKLGEGMGKRVNAEQTGVEDFDQRAGVGMNENDEELDKIDRNLKRADTGERGPSKQAEAKDFDPAKQKADGGGLRFDTNKNQLNLIRPLMEWGLANVFSRGAIKYSSNNWMRGMKWSQVLGPLKRHVAKWNAGEVYDKDTGCHHMFMVAWNAFVLAFYQLMHLGENDLGVGFDHEFLSLESEIDAFDLVNNKPVEQYIKELEEAKKGK